MKNSHLSFIDKFQYFFSNSQQAASFQDRVIIIGDYWYEFRLIVYDAEKTTYSTDLEKGTPINCRISTTGAWCGVVHWATLE